MVARGVLMKQFRAYIILFGIMEESQETDDADGSCHNFDSSGHGLKLAFHAFITILSETGAVYYFVVK